MPQKEILDYIKTQRTGVLAIEMPDGSPHGSTVHFACSDNPFVFYFETNKSYRKTEALVARPESRASLVIGTTEAEMKTLQLDGLAALILPEEKEYFDKVYIGKFPEKQKKIGVDDSFVFFKFTPTWWRFTDWKAPGGKQILTSDK